MPQIFRTVTLSARGAPPMNLKTLVLLVSLLPGVGAGYAAEVSSKRYDQTFTYCRDVDGYLVNPPEWKQPQAAPQMSASNDFSPLPDALLRQLKVKGNVLPPATIRKLGLAIDTLSPPQHGSVKDLTPPDKPYEAHVSGGKTAPLPLGTTSYHYTFMPNLGYLGKDQAAYEVRANGKRYKVIVNFFAVTVFSNSGMSLQRGQIDRMRDAG